MKNARMADVSHADHRNQNADETLTAVQTLSVNRVNVSLAGHLLPQNVDETATVHEEMSVKMAAAFLVKTSAHATMTVVGMRSA
jgi:hypothetical protein